MKEKQHRYSTTSVVLGAITVIAVFVMLGVASQSWQAKLALAHIEVKGERLVAPEDILRLSGIVVGDNYETIDLEKVAKRVRTQPLVKDSRARRTLHEGIVIEVTERIPVAALTMNGSLVFVDDEMVILPPEASHEILDLPIVTSCVEGGKIDSARLRGAVALLGAVAKVDLAMLAMISEVIYRDGLGYVALSVDGAVPVRFGEGNDENSFLDRVRTFRAWKSEYAPAAMPLVSYIDVRFTKQVVVKTGRDIVAQAEVIH